MEFFYESQQLEPGEILVLLEWLDSFCEEVKAWGSDEIPVFVEAKKKLLLVVEKKEETEAPCLEPNSAIGN